MNKEKSLNNSAAKPNFKHLTICDEIFVAVQINKSELVFNKLIYLGMSILDLSKTLMYDFQYKYVKQNMVQKQSCYLLILTVNVMKFKHKSSSRICKKTSQKSLIQTTVKKIILQEYQLV